MTPLWGWKRTDKPSGVHWVSGEYEATYERVAADGGTWVLVASIQFTDESEEQLCPRKQ
jgi:hypothetical protein